MAKTPAKKKASRYASHPGLAMEERAKVRLERDTGKSWDAWIALARKKRFASEGELRAWLREEHEIPGMTATWIAHAAFGGEQTDYTDPETLVAGLYSGSKERLRPLHEKLVDAALACGGDVLVTACKTMVPVYRKHVFAQMRPVEDAVEVQFALGDAPAKGRLEPSASRMPGDRLSHRTLVRSEKEIDAELRAWFARAYELGAAKIARATTDVEPSPELRKGIAASKAAKATWDSCTPAMKRDVVQWIASAKQEETRDRRVAQALARLSAGHRRMY